MNGDNDSLKRLLELGIDCVNGLRRSELQGAGDEASRTATKSPDIFGDEEREKAFREVVAGQGGTRQGL